MQRILVIQTAFIGDVVLATSILESLHQQFPAASLDIVVRKGNESLFHQHPFIHEVLVWDKKSNKYKHLFQLLGAIRKNKYDLVLNLQRYAATGFLTAFSGASKTIGFNKNPFHLLFTESVEHSMNIDGTGGHEIERNHRLLQSICTDETKLPALYPSKEDDQAVAIYQQQQYICFAPTSVWFTKQFPKEKWIELIDNIPAQFSIYLLGGPGDFGVCEQISTSTTHQQCVNLAGKLSFLQSASLMKIATMNYVNDSAPLHFCSAMNAPVTAVYCSTIPAFGYGPLSSNKTIVETNEILTCRPCGLHGKKDCPLGHFNCAKTIQIEQLFNSILS
ncbi:MAG: glycosyltransferase family 9 protein [Sphingobacteriia bacterium]|nr:MAG: glycosyltransferase family 9 protein [Sphingobacteriia bacterium]